MLTISIILLMISYTPVIIFHKHSILEITIIIIMIIIIIIPTLAVANARLP